MKTYSYKSSNGNTYELVKTYIKFGNKESQPVYYFITPKRKDARKHHDVYELPNGWVVQENPMNGYPLLRKDFRKDKHETN